MEKLYKILKNGKSCNGGNEENWKVGVWMDFQGEIELCKSGYHLTTNPYKNWFVWGADVYLAEARGDIIFDAERDKCVCSSVRLIEKLPKPVWLKKAEDFVASLKSMKYLRPDGKPNSQWKLFTGSTWVAARLAAGDAARLAAGDAAGDAAWLAAWLAAGDAAGVAARLAAGVAAWLAARLAAGVAAGDAAGDASLMACIHICSGLKLEKKHIEHAKKRMEVWQKGYALLCDVDGVLYVYAKESAKTKRMVV